MLLALATTKTPPAYWVNVTKLDKQGHLQDADPLFAMIEVAVERALAKADWRGVGPAQLALQAPR